MKQLVIGLPDAGKTTFLAALWHVVESEEVEGSLKLERLHTDHSYLNRIRKHWSNALPLDRTKIGDEQFVSMLLKEEGSECSTNVLFPDLSGEAFRLQWTDRHMKSEYASLAGDAAGALLLVHPEKVHEEVLISDTENIIKRVREQGERAGDGTAELVSEEIPQATEELSEEEPWEAKGAPTQVQLVDLLQFVTTVNRVRRIKLGILVSAWDLVRKAEGEKILPKQWVEKRLPLLSQYLAANFEIFTTRFFGVSAQGGDLADAEELRKILRPSDRIVVVSEDLSESNDITEPVRWMMQ